ncbi:MAG: hypothetical protein WA354_21860, partial [Terracidiphilus sp.]
EIPRVVAQQVYFPTAYFCMAPFALLQSSHAYLLWSAFTVGTISIAAFLVWTLAQEYAPNAAFYLVALVLANCGIVFAGGNPAGLAIGLCLVAVWCFVEEKYVYVGVFCLALSLELKPHDTGLVWLYFLLAGGVHRKRALQTLALTVALALPALLWIFHVSPHWMQELSANLAVPSAPGEINSSNSSPISDPITSTISKSGAGTIIDLQTLTSVFSSDPRLYNTLAYVISGSLLVGWMVVTLRSRSSLSRDYLAVAIIAPLTMLPVYHRPHDAILLILTIPACTMLLAEGGWLGGIALFLNSIAILITAAIPLGMLEILTKNWQVPAVGGPFNTVVALFARPIPAILLALASFYLWVLVRRFPNKARAPDTCEQHV